MDAQGRLERKEWMRAARLALLRGGPSAVRVEPLARTLRVSKGSFYWHFESRGQLLEALLREWELEKGALFELLDHGDLPSALEAFFRELERRVALSERGESPSDAAIFGWAAVSPEVARRVNREERARIRLVQQLVGDELGEFVYLAFLGFLFRRRRVPQAARSFALLTRVTRQLMRGSPARRRGRHGR